MIELDGVLKPLVHVQHDAEADIDYALAVGQFEQPVAGWLGRGMEITASGAISCRACARPTPASYGQGYCYACFKSLPACDVCIRSPQHCHFAAGTCRDPAWGEKHCMRPHLLYLAVSSGVKVGLTTQHNIPGRWLDQGARRATLIADAGTRHIAGLLEVALARHVTDRTDWRRMIADSEVDVDLHAHAAMLRGAVAGQFAQLQQRFGADAVRWRIDDALWQGRYPRSPDRVVPATQLRLSAGVTLAATLLGVKGQYLLLDRGVLNVRRFAGYDVRVRLGAVVAAAPVQATLF